jgi:hypothetical protein
MSPNMPEKPMRHVMLFARKFRAPLQAEFSSTESDLPDEFSSLLEMADQRINQSNPQAREQ